MKNLEIDKVERVERVVTRKLTDWQIINEEFENFIEGFIVAETILGLNIYIKEEKSVNDISYNVYIIRSTAKFMMQAQFYVLPMTNVIGIEIYEKAFNIVIEECEELKDFNFRQIYRTSIPGDRLLTTNLSLEKFYDLVGVLGNWWHYST